AEANGSIITIGNIVLEKVCEFISRDDWDELGLHSIEMNLSAAQILQRNFIKVVKNITEKYNIDKSQLNFEITETASNNAPAVFTENLSLLREEGYHLILDDFGSGYSNLQRLVTSEFDMIKFDKEMTQRTCDDYKLHDFFERMQNIFHSMGAKVVAEGVETKEQFEYLRSIGCDYIQGYYFSKAVPSDEFVAFIKSHR
ncbi:MAG: EAL domain-containing protein, partial [Pseudobutyrivibrio sp.]|nr:EAL domain-containing protein [Pseudobutyrivibrio sp.]